MILVFSRCDMILNRGGRGEVWIWVRQVRLYSLCQYGEVKCCMERYIWRSVCTVLSRDVTGVGVNSGWTTVGLLPCPGARARGENRIIQIIARLGRVIPLRCSTSVFRTCQTRAVCSY